ncbi:MAG: T9SS type A sorting domain-containing protein [Bacteroidota bacterium]
MNNKIIIFVALLATILAGVSPAMGQKTGLVTDTVMMNPGYSTEVYYNMASGTKASVLRNQWDIAFRTAIRSASIITNDGSGVVLYTYPKSDTSGWASVDTAGFKTWKPLYNSLTDREMGSFNTYSKGEFDYGWGVYNIVTHNLTGDSLYLVKLRNGLFCKLQIVTKASALNKYHIKYAALDGTGEQNVTIDCASHTAKNFIGYSFPDNQVVDFETADASTWDLLFTKYMGLSGTTPYPVTGVLSNYNTGVVNYHPVPLDFRAWDASLMDSSRSAIGYNWKYIDASYVYHIVDSSVYFVQDKGGNIYKLIFKEFAGSTTGRIVLQKEMISAAGINEFEKSDLNAAIYPNPVNGVMNLVINPGASNSAFVSLHDLAGRSVFGKSFELQSEILSTLQIPVEGISPGIYVVSIQAGKNTINRKVIIKN